MLILLIQRRSYTKNRQETAPSIEREAFAALYAVVGKMVAGIMRKRAIKRRPMKTERNYTAQDDSKEASTQIVVNMVSVL